MKQWLRITTLLALLAVIVGGGIYFTRDRAREPSLKLGNMFIKLEIADTETERAQGLSGRESLAQDRGMLFVFDDDGRQCMWMKDMKFALDMVWLDSGKKVIDMRQAVSPDTYPESFCASQPARYVIEINDGLLARSGVKAGDTIQF